MLRAIALATLISSLPLSGQITNLATNDAGDLLYCGQLVGSLPVRVQ